MLVDTHCHLGDRAYDADRLEVVKRAAAAGVGHVVVVGESREASELAFDLARRHPQLSATAGVHPHVAATWSAETGSWLAARLQHAEVVAVGETGLDYHYDHSPRSTQRIAFDAQLELAEAASKPAVVHARDADDDVAAVLRDHPAARCVLHSFSSGMPLLRAGIALGHYISFSGMITFRNWDRDDAIRETPLDRILVETDGPYLAPVPYRGKRNEPAFVIEVARRLAAVLKREPAEVMELTTANARRLFGDRLAPALS